MTREEKAIKVAELYSEQLGCLKKSIDISLLPAAIRPSTSIRRAFRIAGLMLRAKQLEDQRQAIIAQPNFEKGGLAVVGETGDEPILLKDAMVKFLMKDGRIIGNSDGTGFKCNIVANKAYRNTYLIDNKDNENLLNNQKQ
jgi:hypothetical protein